jgi:CheY-like chemotaxis protein
MANQSCKVLVIDDERDGADSAVMLLQLWGHEAVAAYSAGEAFETARSFDPDVVLMDIGLPGKNGFDLANDIRALCPGVKIVALTGFTQADIVQRSRAGGFDDHLLKPAEPAALKEAVDTQCEKRAAGAR